VACSCEHGNETYGSIKHGYFFSPLGQLWICQGLCFIKLGTRIYGWSTLSECQVACVSDLNNNFFWCRQFLKIWRFYWNWYHTMSQAESSVKKIIDVLHVTNDIYCLSYLWDCEQNKSLLLYHGSSSQSHTYL
jgi:hypothetical protein